MRRGQTVLIGTAQLVFALASSAGATPSAAAQLVSDTGAGIDAEGQRCLTEAVYYEAGFEPHAGQEAVAQVVLNRLRSPSFPKTLCGVVYQRSRRGGTCQFTFACDGALSRRRAPAAWAQAELVARAALTGAADSAVGDALNYHAWYVAPNWSNRLQLVTRVGAHLFYRAPTAIRMAAVAPAPGDPGSVVTPPAARFAPWGLSLQPAGADQRQKRSASTSAA